MNNRREFLLLASAFPTLLSARTGPQAFKAGTCLGGRDEEGFWKNTDNAKAAGFRNIESSGAGVRLADLYEGRSAEFKQQLEKRQLNLVGYAQYSPMSDRSAVKQLIDLHLRIARVLEPLGTGYITQLLTPPPKAGVPPAKLPAAMTPEEIRNFTANLNDVAKSLRTQTKLRIGFHAETPEVAAGLLGAVMEGTDPKYGARHLKRAIERFVVFPLANLVATGQVKLGDFIRIDMDSTGKMTFVKEAEGALVPVLLEKYGPEFVSQNTAARANRSVGRREAAGGSLLDHK